ncbi:MAG: extracellular solute-binding protein [Pseudolysinimonas sp.]
MFNDERRQRSTGSRQGRLLASAAILAAVLAGCGALPDAAGSDPNNADQVEVFSWWTAGSEKRGFDALMDAFDSQNPGIQLIDASVRSSGGSEARAALESRLDGANPPDTFQAVAGAGLSDYVARGQLQDLTDFYALNDLESVYRDSFLDLLRADGKIYSVPVDIQRANIVWSNSGLLGAAGVDPSTGRTTIDYWITDLQKVRDSGVDYPLALGAGWTQVQLFESVLIADLGPVVYKDLWKSADAWQGDALLRAIDHYGRLLDFVDPASRSEDAAAIVHRVVNGEAAYVVMVDSAAVAFAQAETSGDWHSYNYWPVPGTKGIFDFSVDSFTLPVGAAHEASAEAWLLSVSSAEGQRALTLETGSIPARIDTDVTDYSEYQQTAIASLQEDTVAASLAYGVAASPSWTTAITEAIVKFRDDRHPEALANSLISAAERALAG